jgi:hypothetical protein
MDRDTLIHAAELLERAVDMLPAYFASYDSETGTWRVYESAGVVATAQRLREMAG